MTGPDRTGFGGRPVATGGVVALGVAALLALALAGGLVTLLIGAGPASASLDQVYRFSADGTVPAAGQRDVPVAPGSVTARWYDFRGWNVVEFDGLDLAASGPLCLGTAVLDSTTHQLDHILNVPTAPGACSGGGAGVVVPPPPGAGLRECGGRVAVITTIPSETRGVLHANLAVFHGDGTSVGISGRVAVTAPLGRLDASALDCGPLPVTRATLPPPAETASPSAVVATPAPASTGRVAAGQRVPPPSPARPDACPARAGPGLEDVTDGESAPYLVRDPAPDRPDTPTVIFLPGGSGERTSAVHVWETVFANRPEADRLRIVIPYSRDGTLIDETGRILAIRDEVLSCRGGDPAELHIAGTSNGGLAAFALMASHPEDFATLLGAPGAFPVQNPATVDPTVWARTLAGRAVFNGVGERDEGWRPEVIATHNALVAAGIESLFVEFPGQGHVLNAGVDPRPFFAFWLSH